MTLGDRQRPPVGDQSGFKAREPRFRGAVYVDLGNGNMGSRTNRFDLGGMFASTQDLDFNGSGRADTVYFRVRSGNIYRLSSDGRLVNRDESIKAGALVIEQLDPYRMVDAEDLLLDTDFRYPAPTGGIIHTARLVEIVATAESMNSDPKITGQRKSLIVTDFYRDLPQISPVGDSV